MWGREKGEEGEVGREGPDRGMCVWGEGEGVCGERQMGERERCMSLDVFLATAHFVVSGTFACVGFLLSLWDSGIKFRLSDFDSKYIYLL